MRKQLTGLIAAAAMTGAVLVGSTAPAQADVCPSGGFCAYSQYNYGGSPGVVYGNNTNLQQYTKFANAKSMSNSGTQCSVRAYSGRSYTGSSVLLQRGYGIGNLSGTAYYNHVYSNRWC